MASGRETAHLSRRSVTLMTATDDGTRLPDPRTAARTLSAGVPMTARPAALAAAIALLPAALPAQSTRLLHQPDVSAQYVAFAYAGDIWLAPRAGGDARRVTSSPTV